MKIKNFIKFLKKKNFILLKNLKNKKTNIK